MKTIHRSTAVRSLLAAPEPQPPRDLLDPLIRRAAQGDRNAIGALARTFRPRLVAAATAHLDNDCDAEDLVQDLFVLLLEGKLDPPLTREPALGWLLRGGGHPGRGARLGLTSSLCFLASKPERKETHWPNRTRQRCRPSTLRSSRASTRT